MVSGGITKFSKANPRHSFRLRVKKALDYAVRDVPKLRREMIEGSVTGLMQAVFEFWQLQATIAKHNPGRRQDPAEAEKEIAAHARLDPFARGHGDLRDGEHHGNQGSAVVAPERSRSIEAAGALAPAVAHS